MSRIDAGDLAAALPAANVAVLVAAVAHLTGDLSVIDAHAEPRTFDHGRGPGSLSDADADAIRAWAFAALTGWSDDPAATVHVPDAATLHRLIEFVAGEAVDAEYVPLVEEEADFDGVDLRRFEWTQRPDAETLSAFHVGIIGAGLGGLCAAIRLEQAGIPYTVFDKNADVGGTWFENTYPDLRVDVPNHFYSYSFRPNADWSHYYARQHELFDYIAECAEQHRVLPHVRFGTEVVSATWEEVRGTWRVSLRDGDGESEMEVNALVSAVGMLNRPAVPAIDGLDTFAGPCFHSSRWDHGVDVHGKRVAVVGTGASAMQFVPAIAADAEHVTIFQRSRHWVTPNPDYHRPVTDQEKWLFRNVPRYLSWYRVLQFWNSADRMYPAFRVDPAWADQDTSISRQNDKLRRVMTAHAERELASRPDLVDDVLPDYPALGKRMLQDNGWYRTLLRDDVDLVNERVTRVEPHAVITESGARVDADVLVLGTGFHPNKYLWPMEITGRDRVLHEEWGDDPRAYVGITMPGFPNLFCLYGPNTNPVVGSVVFVLECQVNYVVKAIGAMLERGWTTMECKRDVHDAYNERIDAEHEQLVWRHPRVHSYYNNDAGRVTTNMPWKLVDYWRMTHEPALEDFVVTGRNVGLKVGADVGRLDGKVAIVTGGASGFGRATGLRFAREGARVVVADLDEARGRAVVEELGDRARLVTGDVSCLEVAQQAVATAVDDFGGLDVLVNNAGIVQGDDRDTWDTTEEQWDQVLQVNLRSVFVCSKAAIPAMLQRGGGSIVNVASIAASVCTGGSAYAASKGAILSYTRHTARELARRGVRMNAVSPGFMRTPMTTGERDGLDEAAQEERVAGFAAHLPMKRMGAMDDIADAILFLASDEASYVTGQELIVDGGYVVR